MVRVCTKGSTSASCTAQALCREQKSAQSVANALLKARKSACRGCEKRNCFQAERKNRGGDFAAEENTRSQVQTRGTFKVGISL